MSSHSSIVSAAAVGACALGTSPSRRADLLERRLVTAQLVAMAFTHAPGLRLSVPDAARLTGCEEGLAARTLAALAEAGFLTRLGNGAFGRAWLPAATSTDPPAP